MTHSYVWCHSLSMCDMTRAHVCLMTRPYVSRVESPLFSPPPSVCHTCPSFSSSPYSYNKHISCALVTASTPQLELMTAPYYNDPHEFAIRAVYIGTISQSNPRIIIKCIITSCQKSQASSKRALLQFLPCPCSPHCDTFGVVLHILALLLPSPPPPPPTKKILTLEKSGKGAIKK